MSILYNDPDVAEADTITIHYVVGNANYTVETETHVGSITPKVLSLSGWRVYDGSTKVFGLDFGTIPGVQEGETLALSGETTVASKNVSAGAQAVDLASLTLTAGGLAKLSNYTLVGGNHTFGFTPAPMGSIQGIVALDKVYDGTTSATLDMSGATFAGRLEGDDIVMVGGRANFVDKHAGEDKEVIITEIEFAGADVANYDVDNTQSEAQASITKASLTFSGFVVKSKNFDGKVEAEIAQVGKLVGVVSGDDVAMDLSKSVAVFADSDPGMDKVVTIGPITLVGADAGNYEHAGQTTATADITLIDAPSEPAAPQSSDPVDTSIEDRRDDQPAVAPTPGVTPAPASPASPVGATLAGAPIQISFAGSAASLTLPAQGGQDRPLTQSTLTVYRQQGTQDATPQGSLAVTLEGNQVSVDAQSVDEQAVATLAINEADLSVASAPLQLDGGITAQISVGVTADGVLVVSVEGDGEYDANIVVLSALALAEMQLGVDMTSLTAVVLR